MIISSFVRHSTLSSLSCGCTSYQSCSEIVIVILLHRNNVNKLKLDDDDYAENVYEYKTQHSHEIHT